MQEVYLGAGGSAPGHGHDGAGHDHTVAKSLLASTNPLPLNPLPSYNLSHLQERAVLGQAGYLGTGGSAPGHGCNCLSAASQADVGYASLAGAVEDFWGDAAVGPGRCGQNNRAAASNGCRDGQHDGTGRQHSCATWHVQAN